MRVTVISPEAALYDGEADALVIPAYDGMVGILPHHAPFMTLLGTGPMTLRHGGSSRTFNVQGGFLQVVSNTARIVAEHVEGGTNVS